MEFLLEGRSLTVHFEEEGEHRQRAINAMAYVTTEDLAYPVADDSIVVVEIAQSIDPFSAITLIKQSVAGLRIGQVNVPVNEKYL